MTTADSLIRDSIQQNRIATAPYTLALYDALGAACDNSTEDTGRATVEFLGTSDDGEEWRVHLTGVPACSHSSVTDENRDRLIRAGILADDNGDHRERMGSCDACGAIVPVSQLATADTSAGEGSFCRACRGVDWRCACPCSGCARPPVESPGDRCLPCDDRCL